MNKRLPRLREESLGRQNVQVVSTVGGENAARRAIYGQWMNSEVERIESLHPSSEKTQYLSIFVNRFSSNCDSICAREKLMTRSSADIYEELLVVRCQRRDTLAWNELVGRYNDRLFYYVRRLVEDDGHSAQLVQDIWVQVFRNLNTLQQTDRLAAWLYTIAHRVVMTHYRQKYAAPVEQTDELVESSCVDEVDAAQLFENAELVHFGLSRIGWTEREVLTLYFLQDLSTEEISRVLEVPTGTVKSRLARARQELRSVLGDEATDSVNEERQ